jgi:hypothetical protein
VSCRSAPNLGGEARIKKGRVSGLLDQNASRNALIRRLVRRPSQGLGEGAASGRARLESLKFSRRDYLAWKGLVRELYPLDYGYLALAAPRDRS